MWTWRIYHTKNTLFLLYTHAHLYTYISQSVWYIILCWHHGNINVTTSYIASVIGSFGYPNSDQAKIYCTSFRIALVGTTGLIVCMHAIYALCYRTYTNNQHAESSIFEPLDPLKVYNNSGITRWVNHNHVLHNIYMNLCVSTNCTKYLSFNINTYVTEFSFSSMFFLHLFGRQSQQSFVFSLGYS